MDNSLTVEQLKQEIISIKGRNKKVETDKAWEISIFRKALIAALIYIVIVIFFFSAGLSKLFVNAIVPTLGFILSTLTITIFKKFWVNIFIKKEN